MGCKSGGRHSRHAGLPGSPLIAPNDSRLVEPAMTIPKQKPEPMDRCERHFNRGRLRDA